VQVFGPRMLRYKGVLYMQGADRKVIFQGYIRLWEPMSARNGGMKKRKKAKWCLLAKIYQKTYLFKVWSIV
jgi:hypothetical protein